MARSAKKKWDEGKVTRDENGRFVAQSFHMDIQVGGQRIQRSGQTNPYNDIPYAPGMTPQHQQMIDLKRQLDQRMFRNQQNNTVNPTRLSARRSRKPKIA